MRRLDAVKGRIVPADLEVDVTRNYGDTAQRKSERASVPLRRLRPSRSSSSSLRHRLARGRGRPHRHPDHDPADPLRVLDDGLHDQPRQPVRAHLLDRHPRRRRDRRRREHCAPLGDERRPHRTDAAIEAVAEVGNPTIVATLTIVAALLPMMFVSGLMGPYMSPIPANASIAMLFSFFVAVTVTPWLLLRLAPQNGAWPPVPRMGFTTSARWAASMLRSRGRCSRAASGRRSF